MPSAGRLFSLTLLLLIASCRSGTSVPRVVASCMVACCLTVLMIVALYTSLMLPSPCGGLSHCDNGGLDSVSAVG
ncbi:hypothetical protein COO60DRAFT_1515751 [Scenedesmus sp. NREL 46B-D3]|nr:hypothetical protein COO60DRAFT_1515751 [Scenedesmus sp. NREL 46B-D3]